MDLDIDLLPFPEESTIVDLETNYSNWDLIRKALEIIVEERDLKNIVKLKKSIEENEIVINDFVIQIVFCSFFNEEVIIPTKKWFIRNMAPQLILASKIDEENNIVHFLGVITSQEFKKFLVDNKKVNSEIKIPINKFEGGIEVLFSYIQFIKPSSIPRTGFFEELLEGKIKKSDDFYFKQIFNYF